MIFKNYKEKFICISRIVVIFVLLFKVVIWRVVLLFFEFGLLVNFGYFVVILFVVLEK